MKHIVGVRNLFCKLSIAAVAASPTCAITTAAELPRDEVLVKVLEHEQSGRPIDRSAALTTTTDRDELSRWQSGEVRLGRDWRDVRELDDAGRDERMKRYLAYRASDRVTGLATLEYHRHLAKWCTAQGLTDIAQAHWLNVLELAGDDAEAARASGYRQIEGQWYSPEEVAAADAETRRQVQAFRKWMPKLRPVIKNLTSGNSQLMSKAIEDLRLIDDADAVAPLATLAVTLTDQLALPVIETIASIRSEAACEALLAITTADPTSPRGRAALKHLTEYNFHYYVPDLIDQLEADATLQHNFMLDEGGYRVQALLFREKSDRIEVTRMTRDVLNADSNANLNSLERDFLAASNNAVTRTTGPMPSNVIDSRIRSSGAIVTRQGVFDQEQIDGFRELEMRRLEELEQRLDEANAEQRQRQANVRHILSVVSGVPSDAAPQAFWDWWSDFANEQNPESSSSESKVRLVRDIRSYERGLDQLRYSRPSRECLIAGTLIATDAGLRPIESLKAGDLVVSQNIENGEIALKPVLRPTSREPARTFIVTTANDKIRSTGGHHWWVVGEGWIKSRDLKPGMALRTSGGYAEIRSVEEQPEPVVTYNLAVADNHTYFVGRDYVLSYDVTPFQPTLLTVPGYSGSEQVTAR